jgi:hypothetical protein
VQSEDGPMNPDPVRPTMVLIPPLKGFSVSFEITRNCVTVVSSVLPAAVIV